MSTSFRTLVRGFLFVDGVTYAVFGALSGSTLQVGFGLFAAVLGGFGLWWTYRESPDDA